MIYQKTTYANRARQDKPETKVSIAAPAVSEAFLRNFSPSALCICMDFSLSLEQTLHFHWVDSLQ
jgi:hypothetical protein